MRVIQVDATSLLGKETSLRIDVDVKENIEAIVQSHVNFLGEYYASLQSQDPNFHLCLVAIDESTDEVVGYRYFYFEPGKTYCELFATYVAVSHRRRGIAKILFHKAIDVAHAQGCSHFTIRFASPTAERAGLVEYYRKYAKLSPPSLAFTIYYDGQHLEYPRPTMI